jgi:LPS sulfotransferase NodH
MLPSQMQLPGAYKILNSFGSQLDNLGIPIAQMDIPTLRQVAERDTGLNDFGDSYFREGLEILLQSIEQDANLHFFGKLITRMVILNYMTQRLLFVEAQKQTPFVFRTNLNAPVIITGIPRSGTTFLHRMISIDPTNSGVPFWRLFRPFPTPNKKDLRESTARWELKFRRPIFPEMDSKHYIREDQEEECIWMLGLTFHSIVFWVIAPVSSYAEWLFTQDRTKYYQEYCLLLKAQQQVVPVQNLILKAPDHTPNLNTLLSVIPNAKIIQLHREPTTCLTSLNSLFYSTHRSVTKDINPKRLAEVNKKMFTYYLETNRNICGDLVVNNNSLLDIQYSQLVADPIGTVRKIYTHFDMPWTKKYAELLQIFVNQHTKDKYGKHHYTPEQFGQSSQELREYFAPLYDQTK